MGTTTQRVSAKRFLQDYRTGKSDEELMAAYGLSRKALDKLLKRLVAEQLLDASEVRSEKSFEATVALDPAVFGERSDRAGPRPVVSTVRKTAQASLRPGKSSGTSSTCPQCGASVTEAMLICPECGHVLPGEERWARVEPTKSLLDRIPPKVLGSILAIPVAIALVFVFKDIIIPMTDATIEKQAESARKKDFSSSAERASRGGRPERTQSSKAVETVVRQLIEDEILTGANPEFSVFYAGRRWWEIMEDERIECMEAVRSAMGESLERFEFRVVDSGGKILARVTETSLSLASVEGGP